jgi:YVTN family beta-propeller protein
VATPTRLTFRILGPLEVSAGGSPLPLGGPRQRALLALLLLDANRVVSRDRLVDELFSGQHVQSGDGALRVQVSRLRRTLGALDGELLVRRPPGYVLTVAPDALDLLVFERLAAEARAASEAGDHARAATTLREAESLWRGRPLADVELAGAARLEVERLAELRVAVTEQRVDAELALGRHADLVPELEALVGAYPLRERLRAQLMLALYRSGRQAEALEAYRSARALTVEQLGLEPGPELKRLEQAILRHEPTLDLPPRHGPSESTAPVEGVATAAPTDDRRPPRWRRALVLGVAVAFAASIALAAVALHERSSPALDPISGDRLVLVSTPSGRLAASISLRATATQVVAGLGSLWVTEADADSVERIDARSRASVQTIRVGDGPFGIAVAGGDIWVANTLDGTVSRVDASTNEVVEVVPVGGQPGSVLAAGGSVWVTNRVSGTVSRIDPATGRVTRVVRVGRGPACLASAAGILWVCNEDEGTVTRIELRSADVVDTVRVSVAPSAIVATATRVWVLDRLDATLSLLDPTSDSVVETHSLGGRPSGIALAGSSLWVADDTTGRIGRLDPARGTFAVSAVAGEHGGDVVTTPAGVWVASTSGGPNHRGGTLRLVETTWGNRASIDPAVQTFAPPLALQGLTNDGLLTLNHVPGPNGARLVPDLALSAPAPTDGGLTYTFRLRPAIRYSTGGTVRASDVRYSFERLFHPRIRSVGGGFFTKLVGAAACVGHPARPCDLSRGIVTDDRSGTVSFHLSAPDPDFLFKLTLSFASVLPEGTPNRIATSGLPATGPYMVHSVSPAGEVVLVRNPRFREWSHAAQPSGYPDRIEWRLPTRISGARMAAEGRVDLTPVIGSLGPDDRTLRTRYPGRLRVNWFAGTAFWFLNVNAEPFDDVRVRRAVNYAIDRNRVVEFWGGAATATPTCQLIPPLLPGFRRYCPHTLRANPTGVWQAPDLQKARRLVAASGTSGMRVTVWTDSGASGEGHYLASVLRQLGYRAKVAVLPIQRLLAYAGDSRNHVQVVPGGWSADYPSPSNFIGKLACRFFTPGDPERTTDLSEHCDPAFDRRVERAQALQTVDPAGAAVEWAKLDRYVTDRALVLPTVSFRETDVLSPRVGNYQYHLLWGPLVDQLWVR